MRVDGDAVLMRRALISFAIMIWVFDVVLATLVVQAYAHA